jgi:AAA15 family ATPase/GTPase
MLIQYSVTNYKSIKEEVVINFSAQGSKSENDWIVDIPVKPNKLYKAIGLIGPNASGKTNIIKSMEFALAFISRTIKRKDNSKINVAPFKLDDVSVNENTDFEFIYFFNGIKYVYGFSINRKRVEEEYLWAYYTIKPTTIFNRHNCNEYDFKGNDVSQQKEYSEKTSENRLYLPVAAEWGYSKAKEALAWFKIVDESINNVRDDKLIVKVVQNSNDKKLLLEMLRHADFDITNIETKRLEQTAEKQAVVYNFIKELGVLSEDEQDIFESYKIYITHSNEENLEYTIDMESDSAGTKTFLIIMARLIDLGNRGGLILMDEFGKTFHTKLSEHYMKRFSNPNINKKNGQLLFDTHDVSLLNVFDPRQIYLIDKCQEGYTCCTSLSDYSIRSNDNIELGYLKGRYSAIPYFKEIL